jgi:signal peptidase I
LDQGGQIASLTQKAIACDSAGFAELSVEILGSGKALRFRARGYSMHPLVRDGDVLLVQPAEPSALRRGDLVLFRNRKGEMVVHRMIRRVGRNGALRFEFKGDRLTGPDELVPVTQIFGQVSSLERDGTCIDVRKPGMRLLGLAVASLSPLGPQGIRSVAWLKALIQRAPLVSKYLG